MFGTKQYLQTHLRHFAPCEPIQSTRSFSYEQCVQQAHRKLRSEITSDEPKLKPILFLVKSSTEQVVGTITLQMAIIVIPSIDLDWMAFVFWLWIGIKLQWSLVAPDRTNDLRHKIAINEPFNEHRNDAVDVGISITNRMEQLKSLSKSKSMHDSMSMMLDAFRGIHNARIIFYV